RNTDIVYTGFQFGNYFRLDRGKEEQTYIQPKHELGENPYRFNWQTPILLSPHNQDILYLGGNKLMRSMDRGDNWTAISFDLTQGGKKGNVAYGTLTSIAESPFEFGLLYTGSDDGLVYVSRNSGGDWKKISNSFPKDLWVSRVVASSHKKARVYVSLNGYRWDDFTSYVYVSEDFGETWKNIASNLPDAPVNVIKEDPSNMDILYAGTDNGVYVSLDRGASWDSFAAGLPNVAYHDLVVQPEARDLVLGTHGRSIYVGDISLLQQINSENRNSLIAGEIESIRASQRWGSTGFNSFGEPFEPGISFQYYVPVAGKVNILVMDAAGNKLQEMNNDASRGINITKYDLTISEKGKKVLDKAGTKVSKADNEKYYLPKGTYKVVFSSRGMEIEQQLEVK
ncbi:MAG: glycosyl hydrolase, partial [Flavobacteriaceae bacterium]|nr:glycosyl hydrolase [Flavobacteriaceae bacterium]